MDLHRAPKTLPGGVLGYVLRLQRNSYSEPEEVTLPGEPAWFGTASEFADACRRHKLRVRAKDGVHLAPVTLAD